MDTRSTRLKVITMPRNRPQIMLSFVLHYPEHIQSKSPNVKDNVMKSKVPERMSTFSVYKPDILELPLIHTILPYLVANQARHINLAPGTFCMSIFFFQAYWQQDFSDLICVGQEMCSFCYYSSIHYSFGLKEVMSSDIRLTNHCNNT